MNIRCIYVCSHMGRFPCKSRLMQKKEALFCRRFSLEKICVCLKDVFRENFTVSSFPCYEKLLVEKLMVRLQRENKKVSIVFEKSSGNPERTAFNLDRNRDADFFKLANFDIQLR